ncbi:MAG: CehA/McbA family metallohydrolase [Candidatus Heimdallarchaeaceae archaeon]
MKEKLNHFTINDVVLDLHVHSHYSNDCKSKPKELIKRAEELNLRGLAITDHNTTKFHHNMETETSLLIVPGVEISTTRGHIIGLGIKENIPKRLSVEETIEQIKDMGGEVIVPHPFDFTRKGIGKKVNSFTDIAIETVNASCFLQWFNNKAQKYAIDHNLGQTGGSDSHRIQDLGLAYTIFPENVNTLDDVLEAIRKKRTRGEGTHLTITEKVVRTFQIHF